MPFRVEDISFDSRILNPFGIIRFNKDNGQGHGGIDIPLKVGSNVLAVAAGEVIEVSEVSNLEGDEKLAVLFEGQDRYNGWIFIYEHIDVDNNLKVGDGVKTNDILGKHILNRRTSHYQIVFDKRGFAKDSMCWPDLLNSSDKDLLDSFWNKYRESDYALNAWGSIIEDEKYVYKALFNNQKYPDGMQLCYPMNTDSIIPLN